MKREPITATAAISGYTVAADRGTLTETEVLGAGKGYAIELKGAIDANWLSAYRKLRLDSPSFFRFCLEGDRVLFACRAGDVVTNVNSILGILDMLLERANGLATASQPSE